MHWNNDGTVVQEFVSERGNVAREAYHAGQTNYIIKSQNVKLCCVFGIFHAAEISAMLSHVDFSSIFKWHLGI